MNPVLDVPVTAHFTLNHPGKQLTDEEVKASAGTALLWRASWVKVTPLGDARPMADEYGNTRVKPSLSSPGQF